MKNKDLLATEQNLSSHFRQSILDWYQEYQSLDDLSAKIDWMEYELKHVRQKVEHRMSEIDQLFNPDID